MRPRTLAGDHFRTASRRLENGFVGPGQPALTPPQAVHAGEPCGGADRSAHDCPQNQNRPRAPITKAAAELRLDSVAEKPPASHSFNRGDRHAQPTAAGADRPPPDSPKNPDAPAPS